MQRPRHQFLARPALARHQNGDIRRSHPLDHRENILHLRRRSHQRPQHPGIPQLPPRRLQLHIRLALPRGVVQNRPQPHRIDRLGDVVVRSHPHRFHGRLDRALRRQHHHRNPLRQLPDPVQQLHSIHPRHLQVRHHNRRSPLHGPLQALHAIRRALRPIAPALDQLRQAGPRMDLIFNNQNLFQAHTALSTSGIDISLDARPPFSVSALSPTKSPRHYRLFKKHRHRRPVSVSASNSSTSAAKTDLCTAPTYVFATRPCLSTRMVVGTPSTVSANCDIGSGNAIG